MIEPDAAALVEAIEKLWRECSPVDITPRVVLFHLPDRFFVPRQVISRRGRRYVIAEHILPGAGQYLRHTFGAVGVKAANIPAEAYDFAPKRDNPPHTRPMHD